MNEQQRWDLEQLKERQTRLAQELALLGKDLQMIEERLRAEGPEVAGPVEAGDQPREFSGFRSEMMEDALNGGHHTPDTVRPQPQRLAPKPVPLPPPPIIAPAPVSAPSLSPPAPAAPPLSSAPSPQRPRLHVDLGAIATLKGLCRSCGGHLE